VGWSDTVCCSAVQRGKFNSDESYWLFLREQAESSKKAGKKKKAEKKFPAIPKTYLNYLTVLKFGHIL